MNKIFRRAFRLTCVVLGGLTFMSCKTENAPESNVVVIEGRPDYSALSETNVLRIGAWVSPPAANWNGMGNPDFATLEQYQAIQESGINVIYALYENANHPVMKRVTEYCAQLGIKYLGRDTEPTFIENGEEYMLQNNEFLYIEYTPSTTSEDGTSQEQDPVKEIYKSGTIIRPNGFEGGLRDSSLYEQEGHSPLKTISPPKTVVFTLKQSSAIMMSARLPTSIEPISSSTLSALAGLSDAAATASKISKSVFTKTL